MIDLSKLQEALGSLGLEGSGDIAKLTKEIQEMEVQASSGGDMVTVTVVGARRVKRVAISADAFADKEILEDLVVSAVNSALEKAEAEATNKMREIPASLLSAFGAGPRER